MSYGNCTFSHSFSRHIQPSQPFSHQVLSFSLYIYMYVYIVIDLYITVFVCILFREQAKISSLSQKISKSSKKFVVCCCESSEPTSQNGFCRRDILLSGLAASVATVFPVEGKLLIKSTFFHFLHRYNWYWTSIEIFFYLSLLIVEYFSLLRFLSSKKTKNNVCQFVFEH